MDDFNWISHVPVFMANMNVGHAGTYTEPHGDEFAKVPTSWSQWQLKGDEEAGKMFTGSPIGLSKSPLLTVEKKKIEWSGGFKSVILKLKNLMLFFYTEDAGQINNNKYRHRSDGT